MHLKNPININNDTTTLFLRQISCEIGGIREFENRIELGEWVFGKVS